MQSLICVNDCNLHQHTYEVKYLFLGQPHSSLFDIFPFSRGIEKKNVQTGLTFRHRASCILGQPFHYSPENAFYIFNQQIYFII